MNLPGDYGLMFTPGANQFCVSVANWKYGAGIPQSAQLLVHDWVNSRLSGPIHFSLANWSRTSLEGGFHLIDRLSAVCAFADKSCCRKPYLLLTEYSGSQVKPWIQTSLQLRVREGFIQFG